MYHITYGDTIINTIIQISDITNKRIITKDDIIRYQQLIISLANKNNVKISFNDNSSLEEINNLVRIIDNKYFVMLPEIEIVDLINYCRGYMPLELLIIMVDKNIQKELVEKYQYDETLNHIITNTYQKLFEEHQNIYHELEIQLNSKKEYLQKLKKYLNNSKMPSAIETRKQFKNYIRQHH